MRNCGRHPFGKRGGALNFGCGQHIKILCRSARIGIARKNERSILEISWFFFICALFSQNFKNNFVDSGVKNKVYY